MSLHILHNSHRLSCVQRLHNINILSQNNLTDRCLIIIMIDTGHVMITEVLWSDDSEWYDHYHDPRVVSSQWDNHNFHSCWVRSQFPPRLKSRWRAQCNFHTKRLAAIKIKACYKHDLFYNSQIFEAFRSFGTFLALSKLKVFTNT